MEMLDWIQCFSRNLPTQRISVCSKTKQQFRKQDLTEEKKIISTHSFQQPTNYLFD